MQQSQLMPLYAKNRAFGKNTRRTVHYVALQSASLIDWISDTRSQGYTDLQSLAKCLDDRDIVSDTACSQAKVVLGCHVEMLKSKAAENCRVLAQFQCNL